MILWIKRGTAVLSGILLAAILYEHPGLAVISGILNLAWILEGKMPPAIRRLVGPSILVINTFLSAYAALKGVPAALAMLAAIASLLSWNTGLFLQRWGKAPSAVQHRYLRRLISIILIGLGKGFSALALHGGLTLQLFPTLFLMLMGGFLLLRLISEEKKDLRG